MQSPTKEIGQVLTLQFLTTIQQIAVLSIYMVIKLQPLIITQMPSNCHPVVMKQSLQKADTTKSRLNAILEEVKYGCKVFQRKFEWFISYHGQTESFWDGMILLDTDTLQTA